MSARKILDCLRMKLADPQISFRSIAKLVQCSPTSVSKYWKIFEGLGKAFHELEAMAETEVKRFFTSGRDPSRKRRPDLAEVHRRMAEKHMTLALLWEKYRMEDPATACSYSHYCWLYKRFKRKVGIAMRQLHRPGQKLFVDWGGTKIHWRDPSGGKQVASFFAASLGYSKLCFGLACPDEKSISWIKAHNLLLAFLGGVPELLVCDNLKVGVAKPGKQPVLNRVYKEWARHNRIVVMPARIFRPQDKAVVESNVGLMSRWVIIQLQNRTFDDLDHLNREIAALVAQLNARPFKKLPGSRQSWFEERECAALRSLPAAVFEPVEFGPAMRVPKDYHVVVKGHAYSVPHELRGMDIETWISTTRVKFFHDGRVVADHERRDGDLEDTTLAAHQHPRHRAYAEATPENHLAWAQGIGPATFTVMEHLLGGAGHRIAAGHLGSQVRGLANKHGNERLEAGCARVIELNTLNFTDLARQVRRQGAEAPVEVQLGA